VIGDHRHYGGAIGREMDAPDASATTATSLSMKRIGPGQAVSS
jgi:hypothetical protein